MANICVRGSANLCRDRSRITWLFITSDSGPFFLTRQPGTLRLTNPVAQVAGEQLEVTRIQGPDGRCFRFPSAGQNQSVINGPSPDAKTLGLFGDRKIVDRKSV